MTFSILGPVDVMVDGQTASLGGPKQRTLLALLLLAEGRAVPVERLMAELWGELADRERRRLGAPIFVADESADRDATLAGAGAALDDAAITEIGSEVEHLTLAAVIDELLL